MRRAVRFAESWIHPLLGESKPVRRTNRVLPEPRAQAEARRREVNLSEDEIITTARTAQRRRPPPSRTGAAAMSPSGGAASTDNGADAADGSGTGVVRQWMSEIASGARPVPQGGGTVRAPSEAEIGILTGMFPDIDREVVLGVLQRR